MPLVYKGTTVKKVSYKGTDIKKVYKWKPSTKEYILVFNAAFNAYVRISCWDRTESKSETIENPDYKPWVEEDNRLYSVYTEKNNTLSSVYGADITNKKAAYTSRENEVKEAEKSYTDHHNDPNAPSPTTSIPNPDYDNNPTIPNPHYDNNPTIENYAHKTWESMSNRASSLRSQANVAYRDWQNAIKEHQPQSVIDNLERSYNSLDGQATQAESALSSAFPSGEPDKYIPNPNYDPRETIPNPDYDPRETIEVTNPNYQPWKDEDDRRKKEADKKASLWRQDEPIYANQITKAENAYNSYKTNVVDPAWNAYSQHHNDPNAPGPTKPHDYTAYYPNTSVSLVGTPEQATNGWVDVEVYYGGYNRTCRITSSNTYQSWEGSYDRYSHSAASGSATGSDGYSVSNSSFYSWDAGPFEWEYN